MIDFSNIKQWQIPEGNAIKVEVGSSVLWQADNQAEETYTLSGTWVFNETLDLLNINETFAFTFISKKIDGGNEYYYNMIISANNGELSYEVVGASTSTKVYSTANGWVNEAYRTINCDVLESGGQVVSREFYNFMTKNAKQYQEQQLTAPEISLDGDILTMTATDEHTEEFVIFVGGVETANTSNTTFDLSTLNLSAGTHKITVKARASGFEDSPASTDVNYVVEIKDNVIDEQGLKYTLSNDGKYYTCVDRPENTHPNVIIASEITGIPVRYIGDSAFSNERDLLSVVIPDSIYSIGDSAFYGCDGLRRVIIGNSYSLSIGKSAFSGCTSLENVEYNGGVDGWCRIDFSDQYSNPLYFTNSVYINGDLISGDLVIPEGPSKIGQYAFYGCKALTSITIPNSVNSIGGQAFYECSGLTSVEMGDGVTTIDNSAFAYCDSLTSIKIPNSVTTIGERAFGSCNLSIVELGDGLEWICSYAFEGCDFTRIHIPLSVSRIDMYAFFGVNSPNYTCKVYCSARRKPARWYDNWNRITRQGNYCSVVWGEEIRLVDFKIDGTISLQYEDGMTWAEWVVSEYNTISLYVSDGKIAQTLSDGSVIYLKNDGKEVVATEQIISIYSFTLTDGGGGSDD